MKRSILFVFLVACGGSSADAIGDSPVPSGYGEGHEPDTRASAQPSEPEPDATPAPAPDGGAPAPDATPAPDAAPEAGGPSSPVPYDANALPTCQSYDAKIEACSAAGVAAVWAVSSACNGSPWRYWGGTTTLIEYRKGGLEGCGSAGSVRCCLN